VQVLEEGIGKFRSQMSKLVGGSSTAEQRGKRRARNTGTTTKTASGVRLTKIFGKRTQNGMQEWPMATEEQQAIRLAEHTAAKQLCVTAVPARMETARKVVDAMGHVEVAVWDEDERRWRLTCNRAAPHPPGPSPTPGDAGQGVG
jgi:hypothetical protein